ncbi:MAG: fatty acid cis/trans isomerase [Solimonas sp.]
MPARHLPARPFTARALPCLLAALLLVPLAACTKSVAQPQEPAPPAAEPVVAAKQTYSYHADIQPIFDNKCAACHGCYDSPCQLKLTSGDGLLRGASKASVYDGARLSALPPTRLGIDATSVEQWRGKGFFSVLQTPGTAGAQSAGLLTRMLALGREQQAWEPNARLPDDIALGFTRQNSCPLPDEFDEWAAKHPREGMPLAVTGLSDREYETLTTWVAEGAVVDANPLKASDTELAAITRWEHYLNRPGLRERLVARYIYEHLFIAHLYFGDEARPHFFSLVRSRTPIGQPIVPIATLRPNDDPGPVFYYRLRLVDDSIVEKNHIIYALDDAKREHYEDLFFSTPWSLTDLPDYGEEARANPFATFAAIPPKARYQFLLDNALYFVRTFIRGPVCAGQTAVDVIRDRFWAVFENPAQERYVNDAAYREQVTPLLGLPGQNAALLTAGSDWLAYRHKRNEYEERRQAEYAQWQPKGPTLDDLWDGDGDNHDALLTIFRHYDNAFVSNGLIGAEPDTIWVMDYPLFERTYYELVVNFDVFGNISHQLQTRLYFDLIRNGAEMNFLRFLPAAARKPLLAQWYQNGGKLRLAFSYADIDAKTPTQLIYRTPSPKTEFVTQLQQRTQAVAGPPDTLNRCAHGDCARPDASAAEQRAERALRTLAARRAKDLPVAALMPELSLLRVSDGQQRLVYSLVHDRAHSNVAFLFNETRRLQPQRDRLTIVPGVFGNYPNFAFDVPLADIETFVSAMSAVRQAADLQKIVERWGIRRTNPQFWTLFNDFSAWQCEHEPLEAGILDINRYENL